MSEQIKDLLSKLVDFHSILENKASKLRKLGLFKSVNRTSSFMDYPNDGCPAISSSLNADLSIPVDNNLHCLSLSITFFNNENNIWEVHAELGWSSYDEGFIDYLIVEEEYERLSDLLDAVDSIANKLTKDMDVLVNQIIE